MVGRVGIGGDNPVRIQSMTNTPTLDAGATADQIIRIYEAGADIVRLTVQSIKEAKNLQAIKGMLTARNCMVPLVADVHFNPAIAEVAAALVEKVRINPGNYGIKQGRGSGVLTDSEYQADLLQARENFFRLVEVCRKHGTAIRIGVNHGSLSSRILNRYGNTPAGMVESAMEFLCFCREAEFHQVVVSLKSSNTVVMKEANTRMVARMAGEGMAYPLHLGVTEAGEGDDGRIRSAVGIGTLLAMGIGSTIRVSLTEDPEREISVASSLIMHAGGICRHKIALPDQWRLENSDSFASPFSRTGNTGRDKVPVVIVSQTEGRVTDTRKAELPGTSGGDRLIPDYVYTESKQLAVGREARSAILTTPEACPSQFEHDPRVSLLMTPDQYLSEGHRFKGNVFLLLSDINKYRMFPGIILHDSRVTLVVSSETGNPAAEFGRFIRRVRESGCHNPIILRKKYDLADNDDFRIKASVDFGSIFLNGEGDGLWIENDYSDTASITSLAFSILQACRRRTSKTEFISCPSCGRTMFDIQRATALIKSRTSHLKGLKIAVMGCVVNGPGEMADADYGYVGSGNGKVNLYRKKEVVSRNIPQAKALDELVALIKESGDWVEPAGL
jgi:(E)-4-hydroxy-3-methylbut-2-enyl-diphosphate synthase